MKTREAVKYLTKEIINNDMDLGIYFEDMDLQEQHEFREAVKEVLLALTDKEEKEQAEFAKRVAKEVIITINEEKYKRNNALFGRFGQIL